MPIAFRCPSCSQVLKVPDTLAGRKGKCPKCGAVLAIPAAKTTVETPVRPAVRKARPTEPAIMQEKALRKRPPVELDDDDDETEEEVVERERESRKKKKRKKSPLLMYGLLGGGLFTLLLGCSGVLLLGWWLRWPSFLFGGIDDDLTFMPSGCQAIASLRVDQLMKSQALQELKREVPEVEKGITSDITKEIGLAADDIDQVVFFLGANPKDQVYVIHTKKAVQASDLLSQIKNSTYQETKIGKYALQVPQDNVHPGFCVVDKKRVVMGDKDTVYGVLTRDKKPDYSKNLQAALKEVDFSKTIVFAADVQSSRNRAPGMPFGGNNDFLSVFEKTLGFAFQAKVGADVRYELTLLCTDSNTANDVRKLIDGILVMGRTNKMVPKEIADLMELNLKVSGSKVTGGSSFKVAPVVKVAKQMGAAFQPPPGFQQPPPGFQQPPPGFQPPPGGAPRQNMPRKK